ncbi:MAG: phosphonate dehydrogenase [Verrucomicrobiales bacterium]|nr:phosphonate dehydrogenase [Verrucomicrobiales bacterium]
MISKKPNLVVTHWIHPEVVSFLEDFCDPILNETRDSWPLETLMANCRRADGLMVFMPDTVDQAFLDQCPNLRIIAGALKGYDNFDVGACTDSGVLFTNVPDLLTIPTAELAVALLLGVARKCVPGDHHIRSGAFRGWRPIFYGFGLAGKTVGLVGLGAVGKAFARRLSGFDCRLIATDENPVAEDLLDDLKISLLGLDEILANADVIALFLPLNDETRHLVDARFLERMKPGAILVNVCRGSVVDEEAVADSLERGHLGAYAADVFELEDWALPDRPRKIPARLLENREQTFFTPHLGSAVEEVRKHIAMEAAQQLKSFFAGQIPEHALNPSAFE